MCAISSNAPALGEEAMIARGPILMGFQVTLAFFAWLTAPSLLRAGLSHSRDALFPLPISPGGAHQCCPCIPEAGTQPGSTGGRD